MNAIQLALEKDEEWNQIVDKTQKMTSTLSSLKSRLQSSLTYLLLMKEKKDVYSQTDLNHNYATSPMSPVKDKTKSPVISHHEKYQNYRSRQLQSKSKSPNKIDPKPKTPELSLISNVSAVYSSTSSHKNVSPLKYQNISKQTDLLSTKYTTISERFQIGKFLGRGKFSDVFQAQYGSPL